MYFLNLLNMIYKTLFNTMCENISDTRNKKADFLLINTYQEMLCNASNMRVE